MTKTEMIIGRDDDCDIPINHRSISRQHAKLQADSGNNGNNGKFRIIDLQSANGTMVNGETYAQVELKKGDVIELGHVRLRLVWPGEPMPLIDRSTPAAKTMMTRRPRSSSSPTAIAAVAVAKCVLWIALGLGVSPGQPRAVGSSWSSCLGEKKPSLNGGIAPNRPCRRTCRHTAANAESARADPAGRGNPAASVAVKPVAQFLEPARETRELKEQWDGALLAILRDGLEVARERRAASRRRSSVTKPKAAARNRLSMPPKRRSNATTTRRPKSSSGRSPRPRATTRARAKRLAVNLKNVKEPRHRGQGASGQAPHGPSTSQLPSRRRRPQNPTRRLRPRPRRLPRDQAKRNCVEQGNQAIMQNHVKEAIDLYNQALGADPKFAPAQRALGIAHARAGNGEVSIEHYRAYLRLAPSAGGRGAGEERSFTTFEKQVRRRVNNRTVFRCFELLGELLEKLEAAKIRDALKPSIRSPCDALCVFA